MYVKVEVFASLDAFGEDQSFYEYVMNHSDPQERRRLGESCADAFEAGQVVLTYRTNKPLRLGKAHAND